MKHTPSLSLIIFFSLWCSEGGKKTADGGMWRFSPCLRPGTFFFFNFFHPPADGGKKKSQAHHTSTYYHTCRVNLTQLYSQSSAMIGYVSFSSRGGDSASYPYRRSPLLLQHTPTLTQIASATLAARSSSSLSSSSKRKGGSLSSLGAARSPSPAPASLPPCTLRSRSRSCLAGATT